MSKFAVLRDSPEELPGWQSFYSRLSGRRCVYSDPAYIAFLSREYGHPAELFIYEDDETFLYYPYFKRSLAGLKTRSGIDLTGRFDVYSSWYYGGPLASAPVSPDSVAKFRTAFRDHARRAGCVTEFVRLDPNLGNKVLFMPDEVSFNRETVYVDLAKSRETLWKEFDQSNRWGVNRARREGIVIAPRPASDSDSWTRFSAIYADEMVRKNAPAHLRFNEAFFHRLRGTLPDNVCLLAALRGKEMCGAHLIIFDEINAFAFLSATAAAYWPTQVNNLLWAEAIFWAQDQGKKRYDLQGGRAGVFKFKSHFSTTRGKFFTVNAVHDRPLYEELIAANAPAPESMEKFPPYLP
jgi:hypothetical protein